MGRLTFNEKNVSDIKNKFLPLFPGCILTLMAGYSFICPNGVGQAVDGRESRKVKLSQQKTKRHVTFLVLLPLCSRDRGGYSIRTTTIQPPMSNCQNPDNEECLPLVGSGGNCPFSPALETYKKIFSHVFTSSTLSFRFL